MEVLKSHDDLAIAIQRKSSNIGHALWEFSSLLVLPTEEWQQDNVQSSVVTGDEGRLGDSYMCLSPQGAMKMLITCTCTITLFAKPKAYFKMVLLKIHRLLIYSVHLYLRYSRRCSPQ